MNDPKYVVKSNALVEASYRLTLIEQRIILACISKIKVGEKITDQQQYSVFVKDIAEMSGNDRGSLYSDFSKAILKLKRRDILIRDQPNGNGAVGPGFEVIEWLQYAKYIPKLGEARIRFSHDILPYINELSSHFTRYSLEDISKMTSIYAVRLYELLIQWGAIGRRSIELEFLRDSFRLETRYKLLADFRRFVIEPAVDQINDHSPITVTYEFSKTGRKVTHVLFSFDTKAALLEAEKTAKPKGKPKAGAKAKPKAPAKPKVEQKPPEPKQDTKSPQEAPREASQAQKKSTGHEHARSEPEQDNRGPKGIGSLLESITSSDAANEVSRGLQKLHESRKRKLKEMGVGQEEMDV